MQRTALPKAVRGGSHFRSGTVSPRVAILIDAEKPADMDFATKERSLWIFAFSITFSLLQRK
ncbi:MAG: hypothetical protein LBU32_19440 [Clostridiales bacterium]|nr:hypothetical protein [Clostridiales bacterium]